MRPLDTPTRPLPAGGTTATWRWRRPTAVRPWGWCRVYHHSRQTRRGDSARGFGPLARFDPHTLPAAAPGLDPALRSVLYAGQDLATSACEVFGEAGEARLCPAWRVALLRPVRQLSLFDLTAPGSAMAIEALPSLADGPYPRQLTQAWARAVYEDDPTGQHVDGIRYRSAYNSGLALALWDSEQRVVVVQDAAGTEQDFALRHRQMLGRLEAAMAARHIVITLPDPADCPQCGTDR